MKTKFLSIRELCAIGIFAATIAVMAQLSIPMPSGVPITLQTFAIMLSGIVLGPKKGTLAALVYILLGAVGAPVFTGFSGGFGHIVGPTCGFIISFPIIAFSVGIGESKGKTAGLICGLIAGVLINYLCGAFMFMLIMQSTFEKAVTACIIPYIPGDIVKMILAVILGKIIKAALIRNRLLV